MGLRCVTCVSSRAGLSLRARPFCVVPRRRRGDPGGSGVMCARGGGRPGSYARASARLSAVAGKAELYVTLTRRDRAARSRALCRVVCR